MSEFSNNILLKKNEYSVFLSLFILCFIFYGNSLQNEYAIDDTLVIVNNTKVQKGFSGIPEIFSSFYTESMENAFGYRPITSTSFAIEYELFGENPFASHLINLLLYALTCILIFKVVLKLFHCHWTVAFLVSTLFAIHPLHTEPVNNIKSRDELLTLLFALQSLFLFLKYYDHRKKKHLVFGLLFFSLSFWSKISSMTFVAVIPFLLWATKRTSLKMAIGYFFYLGTGVFMLNTISGFILPETATRLYAIVENPLFEGNTSLIDLIQFSLITVGFYIKSLFVPYPMYAYYGLGAFPDLGYNGPLLWISMLAIVIGVYFAIKTFKGHPMISMGIIFFFITISMFSNLLVPAVGIVADRFAYIASVGFSIMLTGIILVILKLDLTTDLRKTSRTRVLYGVISLLTMTSFFMVFNRNKDWENASHLLQADVDNGLKSGKVFQMLGNEFMYKYQQMKDKNLKPVLGNKAALFYRKSLNIHQDNADVLSNLGVLNFDLANYDQSILQIEKAIVLGRNYPQNYRNLSMSYELKKDYANAAKNLEVVAEIDSTDFDLYSKIIQFKVFSKDYNGALERTFEALNRFPNLKDNYIKAGQQIAEIEHGRGTFHFLDLLLKRKLISKEKYENLKIGLLSK